jgi:anti-sigma-K factor RskA
MTDQDDIDGLAGEYVLGTLDATERTAVAARRQREHALDTAIIAWEQRLSPLLEAIPEITPPDHIYPQIQMRMSSAGGPRTQADADVTKLKRRVSFWRNSAAIASALAASLIVFIGVRELTPKPPSKNLVAVLQKDAASPAFLVSVDVDNRLMTVRPVAAKPEAGKSYELWLVHDSLGAPKSLGVIDEPTAMQRPSLAAYQPEVIKAATFAVSLEPEGGSTTGAPTGPVVFAGKLIPADAR